MNEQVGLRVLSEIMHWSDERARHEFDWLRLMARLKYDGYRDFLAGVRFIESLATWLQQFDSAEREVAYKFVRNRLVYIGPPEMQRLVELFYSRAMQSRLLEIVSAQLKIPKYRVWTDSAAAHLFSVLKRKTLIMGLSDGARVDILRHSNVGTLSNEQIVAFTQVDADKWQDLLGNLKEDLKDKAARFSIIYLVDDFMATGTSCLRFNQERKAWKGKLVKFRDSLHSARDILQGVMPVEDEWKLCVHHYIASHSAACSIEDRERHARAELGEEQWFNEMHFSFGMILPLSLPINTDREANSEFIALTDKYYDPVLRNRHTDVGGVQHLGLGYGGCALPVVLEHNTPNNSVALLWAETEGGVRDGKAAPVMRPLFRRRQRHS